MSLDLVSYLDRFGEVCQAKFGRTYNLPLESKRGMSRFGMGRDGLLQMMSFFSSTPMRLL